MYSNTLLRAGVPVPVFASPMHLPLANSPVRAGAPTSATDFGSRRLDLSDMLLGHPDDTFLLRVAGASMVGYGIDDGDLIVVDRAADPHHGCIVVAVVDQEFTVKVLHQRDNDLKLKAGNPAFSDIVPLEGQTLEIWGVVTSCIKRFF